MVDEISTLISWNQYQDYWMGQTVWVGDLFEWDVAKKSWTVKLCPKPGEPL